MTKLVFKSGLKKPKAEGVFSLPNIVICFSSLFQTPWLYLSLSQTGKTSTLFCGRTLLFKSWFCYLGLGDLGQLFWSHKMESLHYCKCATQVITDVSRSHSLWIGIFIRKHGYQTSKSLSGEEKFRDSMICPWSHSW